MARSFTGARLTAAFASALLLLGTVTACGGGEPKAADSPGKESGGSEFPVTIDHKYGSTKITSAPKRIVTVGLTDQDALLALGTVPVGTTEWLGGYPGAVGPWAKDKLAGGRTPTVLKDTGTGPQVEKIAALKPDLILGLYSGLTKEQYRTLSRFAPVVAQPEQYNDYGIPWQALTTTVGRVLGKEADAKKLVGGVEDEFAEARKANPDFEGATGVIATPYEGLFVFGSQDSRSRMLTDLGFGLPGHLDKAIGDRFGANISKERTDLLDQDAIVWMVADTGKDAAKLRKDPSYGGLKVVKEGREVYVKETDDYGNAISFVSVLSLPYVIERLVPQLAAAVDGDAGTKVEQPSS